MVSLIETSKWLPFSWFEHFQRTHSMPFWPHVFSWNGSCIASWDGLLFFRRFSKSTVVKYGEMMYWHLACQLAPHSQTSCRKICWVPWKQIAWHWHDHARTTLPNPSTIAKRDESHLIGTSAAPKPAWCNSKLNLFHVWDQDTEKRMEKKTGRTFKKYSKICSKWLHHMLPSFSGRSPDQQKRPSCPR